MASLSQEREAAVTDGGGSATTATASAAPAPSGTSELAGWASALDFEQVPERVVAYARSQLLSELAGARAALGHTLGRKLTQAFGSPLSDDPKQAAHVLAALTMCLEYDDTVYAGHVSHSCVNVPLAYARPLELDGRRLLTAIIAATETTARIAAASTLGTFRGQTASHPHLAGAVAGRLRAEDAPAEQWVNALGIAFTLPPWSLLPGLLGSDAKVFTAATPVRTGLDACDAAAAGISGAADIMEHDDGFLARFSTLPLPDALAFGLGTRWHTETLSFKVYPASTGIYAAAESAMEIHDRLGGVDPDAIEEIVVHASIFTFLSNLRAETYYRGADTPVSALQFAVPYGVATALLTGGLTFADFDHPAVEDPARWELVRKLRVEHDEELTRESGAGTAPLGEALRQAGERAIEWLELRGLPDAEAYVRELGPPAETFEQARKTIGSRVTVRLTDGRELEAARLMPTGAAGDDTRARHPQLARDKFLTAGGSEEVADGLATIHEASSGEVAALIEAALDGR
ncbi:MAG TPA: MmgE/PrpD family protein [Thermoleophilaceae bacterium]|jgi:2-methylcitrate dehydratase PrpD